MKTHRWFNRNRFVPHLRIASGGVLFIAAAAIVFAAVRPSSAVSRSPRAFNINTLAGKVAAVNAVQGLGIRFSAFIQEEAEEPGALPGPLPAATPITPVLIPSRRRASELGKNEIATIRTKTPRLLTLYFCNVSN